MHQIIPIQFLQLLSFTNGSDSNDASIYSQPDLILHFKHLKNFKHYSIPNRLEISYVFKLPLLCSFDETNFNFICSVNRVNLQKCETEIDVTLIDRLSHVLENLYALLKTFDRPSDISNVSSSYSPIEIVAQLILTLRAK